MIFSIERSRDARKYFKKANKGFKDGFFKKVAVLQKDPVNVGGELDVKPVKGTVNIYRRRIGGYRIIYEVYHGNLVILMLDIDSRGGIYKGW